MRYLLTLIFLGAWSCGGCGGQALAPPAPQAAPESFDIYSDAEAHIHVPTAPGESCDVACHPEHCTSAWDEVHRHRIDCGKTVEAICQCDTP